MTENPIPAVAIVGRPNVGKSSLFNWLAARRIAIVEPSAGVPRDGLTALMQAEDQFLEVIDTGGMGSKGDPGGLRHDGGKQSDMPMAQAQVIRYVVTVRAG